MSFDNCTEAYRAGYADIPRSSSKYGQHLDRDNDGVGCELKDAPGNFTPRKAEQQQSKTTTSTAQQERLPQTGPGEVTAVGGIVLALGAVAVVVARRRAVKFRA